MIILLNIDRNEIKDTPEYESFGENEFPLKYLSEEELEELGFKKVAVEVEEDVLKSKWNLWRMFFKGRMPRRMF